MIYLKNTSNETEYNPTTIDTVLTEHPLSHRREWTELPRRLDGSVDKLQSVGFKENEQSKKYHIVIKPGEVMAFGGKNEFNEEQAEYIYQIYGSPVAADEYGRKNYNWLLEVNEKGEEILNHFYRKYRDIYSKRVDFQKSNKE